MFEQTVVLGLLAVCSMQDIKTQKIRLNPVLVTGILGVILHMLYQKIQLGNMLLGMGIGIAVWLVSFVTKGKIGIGDAVLLMVTGIYLGAQQNLELFLTALFLAGLWGLYLLVVRKRPRTETFPFVPFLLVAYVEMLVIRL